MPKDNAPNSIEFPTNEVPSKEVPTDLIINALKCVDAAAARGAFQGGELTSVGQVRDGLYILVESELKELVAIQKAKADEMKTIEAQPAASTDVGETD
jgi:hypothetical protein